MIINIRFQHRSYRALPFLYRYVELALIYRGVPYSLSCYTFGAPRVGNQKFVDAFNEKIFDAWSICLKSDFAPSLLSPPRYGHVGHEVVLSNGAILSWPKGAAFTNDGAQILDEAVRSLHHHYINSTETTKCITRTVTRPPTIPLMMAPACASIAVHI
jgi:hypothetical protein